MTATVFFPHHGIAGDWHVCTRDADGAIVSLQSSLMHKDACGPAVIQLMEHA